MVRCNDVYMITYLIIYVFQTFAAIGDFGSVVEQLLMTHGKKITSKIYSIMWKCLSIWHIYTLYLYTLTLLSQRLVSWIPGCIKVRLKLEKTSFDSKMNIYINVFCKCIIDDGHIETSESLKF